METVLRFMLILALAIVGLWMGFALPFLFFLLTGMPLAIVLLTASVVSIGLVLLTERRPATTAPDWIRGLAIGAAGGTVMQGVLVLTGFWSRFFS